MRHAARTVSRLVIVCGLVALFAAPAAAKKPHEPKGDKYGKSVPEGVALMQAIAAFDALDAKDRKPFTKLADKLGKWAHKHVDDLPWVFDSAVASIIDPLFLHSLAQLMDPSIRDGLSAVRAPDFRAAVEALMVPASGGAPAQPGVVDEAFARSVEALAVDSLRAALLDPQLVPTLQLLGGGPLGVSTEAHLVDLATAGPDVPEVMAAIIDPLFMDHVATILAAGDRWVVEDPAFQNALDTILMCGKFRGVYQAMVAPGWAAARDELLAPERAQLVASIIDPLFDEAVDGIIDPLFFQRLGALSQPGFAAGVDSTLDPALVDGVVAATSPELVAGRASIIDPLFQEVLGGFLDSKNGKLKGIVKHGDKHLLQNLMVDAIIDPLFFEELGAIIDPLFAGLRDAIIDPLFWPGFESALGELSASGLRAELAAAGQSARATVEAHPFIIDPLFAQALADIIDPLFADAHEVLVTPEFTELMMTFASDFEVDPCDLHGCMIVLPTQP